MRQDHIPSFHTQQRYFHDFQWTNFLQHCHTVQMCVEYTDWWDVVSRQLVAGLLKTCTFQQWQQFLPLMTSLLDNESQRCVRVKHCYTPILVGWCILGVLHGLYDFDNRCQSFWCHVGNHHQSSLRHFLRISPTLSTGKSVKRSLVSYTRLLYGINYIATLYSSHTATPKGHNSNDRIRGAPLKTLSVQQTYFVASFKDDTVITAYY